MSVERERELRQGSALYPVSFLLRYEFVDVSEQGQPLAGSHSACDRVFRSAQTYSGRFQAPRAIFYYGRGGAQNLTCLLRFEAKQGERVQLTFLGSGDEAICSSGWGERRLRGSSGEIRLFDKRQVATPSEVVGDRNVISESVRAEVVCVHRPWLIEPGGDDATPAQGRYLYVKIPGYEISSDSPICPTPNRIFLYEAHDTLHPREVCPDDTCSIELFSPGWKSPQTPLESTLQPHARSYVIDFLQHEQADYSVKWIEVMKKPAFDHDPDESLPLSSSLSLDCAYR
ncbi:hypothetical protein EVAR_25704_1 [Eumeta japonica]|uniref:DUF7805 domain-containing protein n=1 Tax=Eumeta variegata TaxID=151549 RepID=A0A4C1YQE1_EUMVA|nr:hypothetical protein EVAR_25704_1 [Eumeta japonica]